jgi:hypothetical protein
MQVALPVLTTTRCSSKYPNLIDQYTQVCAGETGQNKDTCQVEINWNLLDHK